MQRALWFFLLLWLGLSGCAPVPFFITATPPEQNLLRETPTLLATATLPPSPTLTPSPIPSPTVTPTDTPLPPLVPPTLPPFPPQKELWQGEPVYSADSKPGYLFQLEYATLEWGLSTDYSGAPALVHRNLPGCFITIAPPRGLPPGAQVETFQQTLGQVTFDVSIVYGANGEIQFMTFSGGDGNILTAFQVNLGSEQEACRQAVERLLSTFRSVPQP